MIAIGHSKATPLAELDSLERRVEVSMSGLKTAMAHFKSVMSKFQQSISSGGIPDRVLINQMKMAYADVEAAAAPLDRAIGNVKSRVITPFLPVEDSVHPDHIICLIDGHKTKALSRYIREKYNLTPTEYRTMFRLPADYPMVPASTSQAHSRNIKGWSPWVDASKSPKRKARTEATKESTDTLSAKAFVS
jgi:predicted transcriptional regulator